MKERIFQSNRWTVQIEFQMIPKSLFHISNKYLVYCQSDSLNVPTADLLLPIPSFLRLHQNVYFQNLLLFHWKP